MPGAEPLFQALREFFSRRKKSDEPTEKEVERDVERLIHGKADGEVVVRNEALHESGGVHSVEEDFSSRH